MGWHVDEGVRVRSVALAANPAQQPRSPIPLILKDLARGDTRGTYRYGH